jgi:hypothetical protein
MEEPFQSSDFVESVNFESSFFDDIESPDKMNKTFFSESSFMEVESPSVSFVFFYFFVQFSLHIFFYISFKDK